MSSSAASASSFRILRKPSGRVFEDTELELRVEKLPARGAWTYTWRVRLDDPNAQDEIIGTEDTVRWSARNAGAGTYTFFVTGQSKSGDKREGELADVQIEAVLPVRVVGVDGGGGENRPLGISLRRGDVPDTLDEPLWSVIKAGTEAISFEHYAAWMDYLFCNAAPPGPVLSRGATSAQALLPSPAPLPFPDIESYRVLKAATEAFLEFNCAVTGDAFENELGDYLVQVDGSGVIPYLARVRQKLRDIALSTGSGDVDLCDEILRSKLTRPCLIELIWSYWHEEGMLVQTMNAISMRFQNRRGPAEIDPLANLTIDPLRPLSNLLWGYIQDEQHRLTLARRAYEYDHEYGLALLGQAVPPVRGADTRSRFLEAFHTLLHRASIFYREDDDTTVIADAFPVLNGLREVHLLLAEGAHNQYRDLPWTARSEMLMQQWLLSRAEFREFLPTRVMVVYAEPWMDRVDAMKKLQGWGDTSVRIFHDLGVFGEQILLGIRYGDWNNVADANQAANWARAWRQEVQWYIHAYQTVTGVDLSADIADIRHAEQARARALPPAFHLQRRLVEEQRRTGVGMGGALGPAYGPLPIGRGERL